MHKQAITSDGKSIHSEASPVEFEQNCTMSSLQLNECEKPIAALTEDVTPTTQEESPKDSNEKEDEPKEEEESRHMFVLNTAEASLD
jgi:hypothetical protein